MSNHLSIDQHRYDRQLRLPGFGVEGQRKLQEAKILLIGVGGLGSPAALYLAAAGVGTLGLCDPDEISLSNLHRQILYKTHEVGQKKTEVAKSQLSALNPEIQINCHPEGLNKENLNELFAQYDLILDGADNFNTRYLVNDGAHFCQKPFIHGSISKFEGQLSVFTPESGCYRCLFPEPPPAGLIGNCSEEGVLGFLPGIIGTMMAAEAIKFITGIGTPLIGRLLKYDALSARTSTFNLPHSKSCPLCGANPKITALKYEQVQCQGALMSQITPAELAELLKESPNLPILDVRNQNEFDLVNIGGQLLPLPGLEARIHECPFSKDQPVYVLCHHGGRSAMACQILAQHGFEQPVNIIGGINRWAIEVDPSLPRY